MDNYFRTPGIHDSFRTPGYWHKNFWFCSFKLWCSKATKLPRTKTLLNLLKRLQIFSQRQHPIKCIKHKEIILVRNRVCNKKGFLIQYLSKNRFFFKEFIIMKSVLQSGKPTQNDKLNSKIGLSFLCGLFESELVFANFYLYLVKK